MSETESLLKHVTVSNNDLKYFSCGHFGLVGGRFGLWQFWM